MHLQLKDIINEFYKFIIIQARNDENLCFIKIIESENACNLFWIMVIIFYGKTLYWWLYSSLQKYQSYQINWIINEFSSIRLKINKIDSQYNRISVHKVWRNWNKIKNWKYNKLIYQKDIKNLWINLRKNALIWILTNS